DAKVSGGESLAQCIDRDRRAFFEIGLANIKKDHDRAFRPRPLGLRPDRGGKPTNGRERERYRRMQCKSLPAHVETLWKIKKQRSGGNNQKDYSSRTKERTQRLPFEIRRLIYF